MGMGWGFFTPKKRNAALRKGRGVLHWWPAMTVLIIALLLALYIIGLPRRRPRRLRVRVFPMAKIVGQNIVVTASALPAGSSVDNVVFTADPALFASVSQSGNGATFACLAATNGAVISATGTASDGTTVSGASDPFDVAAPVATSLTVTVE